MSEPDHIIVGSGINALVCAALLPARARKVLVLERNDRIGGCIRTEEITAPGFVHDVMATTFVLFITSPAYAALAADLAGTGSNSATPPRRPACCCPTAAIVVQRMDRAGQHRRVQCHATATAMATSYGRDVGEHRAECRAAVRPARRRPVVLPDLQAAAGEAWRRGPRGLAAFLGEALTPARGWLESSYQSETARALWAPWVLHAGLGPEDAFSGQIAKVIAFALEAAGAPIVKGGAKNLLDAFEALIKERGGEIRTGADVASIVQTRRPRHRRAARHRAKTIAAQKSVICSVTPTQLYERLLGGTAPRQRPPRRCRTTATARAISRSTTRWTGRRRWRDDGLGKVALLHLTPGLDGVSKACNEAARGMLPETPTICVGQPHALDPSRCPEGKAILWLQLPEAPRHIKGDAAGKLAVAGRRQLDRGVARSLCRPRRGDPRQPYRRLHATACIARRAYSPADLEAMNINLVGGDPYGGSSTIDQSFLWRPFKSSVNHETDDQGPLPYRRVDPSRRRPRRRLRLPAGAETVMDQKVPEKRQRISTLGQIGLQQFAPYLMNRIMGRYNATLRDDFRRRALTIPQVRTLAVLSVSDGVTVSDLSVYTVIEQSTLSRTLDALEAQGLVRREPGETDSRVRKVFLTDEGPRRIQPRLAGHARRIRDDVRRHRRRRIRGADRHAAEDAAEHPQARDLRTHAAPAGRRE